MTNSEEHKRTNNYKNTNTASGMYATPSNIPTYYNESPRKKEEGKKDRKKHLKKLPLWSKLTKLLKNINL